MSALTSGQHMLKPKAPLSTRQLRVNPVPAAALQSSLLVVRACHHGATSARRRSPDEVSIIRDGGGHDRAAAELHPKLTSGSAPLGPGRRRPHKFPLTTAIRGGGLTLRAAVCPISHGRPPPLLNTAAPVQLVIPVMTPRRRTALTRCQESPSSGAKRLSGSGMAIE